MVALYPTELRVPAANPAIVLPCSGGLWRLERRPAPVFFMPAGALLAGVVKQPLRDVLPDRVAAI